MATSPARQPLTVKLKSGLPSRSHAYNVADTVPPAAARLVVSAMRAMASASAAMVEPGLKPNQPSQSTRPPMNT